MFKKCETMYVGELHTRIKMKILQLDRELVLDAIRNVQRVEHFKPIYTVGTVMYDIGDLLFRMRSKFARMTRLLILSHDYLDEYKHNKHIEHMDEIQKIGMEIYAIVEILEDWDINSSTQTTKHKRRPTRLMNATWNKERPSRRNEYRSTTSMFQTAKKHLKKIGHNYEGFDSDLY